MIKKLKHNLTEEGIFGTARSIATLPARRHARKLPRKLLQKIIAHAILKDEFVRIAEVPSFARREDLWVDALDKLASPQVSLLEFGVFEGYSIRTFSKLNTDASSRFFGFDSFIGLPENWTNSFGKGAFDVGGDIPQIDDDRVSFVKGWFQNTLPDFLQNFEVSGGLFVHYDADLHSATLYVMCELDRLKIPYIAVFDEFPGDEARALLDYVRMSGAQVEFLSKTSSPEGYPLQVACRITPVTTYQV